MNGDPPANCSPAEWGIRCHPAAVLPDELAGARAFFTDRADNLGARKELPTLILWADSNPFFTEKYRVRLEGTLPNHTTTVLYGVGHFGQSDAPTEFSNAIGSWWAELAGDGPARGLAT